MIENFEKLPQCQDFHPLKWIAGFEIMVEITGHQELGLRFNCTGQVDVVRWILGEYIQDNMTFDPLGG